MNDDSLLNIVMIAAALAFVGAVVMVFGRTMVERTKQREINAQKQILERETELRDAESNAIAIRQQDARERAREQEIAVREHRQQLEQLARSETNENALAIKQQCLIDKIVVQNGIGRDRGAAVIDVRWRGPDGAHLILLRNRGAVCRDLRELEQVSAGSKRIDFSTAKPNFRHVDIQVKEGKVYNYYAYVEAYFEMATVTNGASPQIIRQSIAGTFRFSAKPLSVNTSESKTELFDRETGEMTAELGHARTSKEFEEEMAKLTGKINNDPLSDFKQFAKRNVHDGTTVNLTEQYRDYAIIELGITDEDEIDALIEAYVFSQRRKD